MKKIMLSLLIFPSLAFCDSKISELPSTTTLNSSDIIPVVTNPGTVPVNYTITKANLISTLGIGSTPYIRSGYSSRFSQTFNVAASTQALDAIFNFTYQAPNLTLATTPSGSVKELGTTFTNLALSAFTIETSSPITTLAFKRNGTVFYNYPSPLSTGGTDSFTDTTTVVSATSVYTAVIGDGTSNTTSNSVTFTYVYPFYYGVGASGLTPAQVQTLTKLVINPANTTTVTSPTSQVYYFAYPQTAGSLISIIDQNGFNTLAGYTQRSVTMTMLDSTTQNYYIYEFNTPTTQTSFSNTYKFN